MGRNIEAFETRSGGTVEDFAEQLSTLARDRNERTMGVFNDFIVHAWPGSTRYDILIQWHLTRTIRTIQDGKKPDDFRDSTHWIDKKRGDVIVPLGPPRGANDDPHEENRWEEI